MSNSGNELGQRIFQVKKGVGGGVFQVEGTECSKQWGRTERRPASVPAPWWAGRTVMKRRLGHEQLLRAFETINRDEQMENMNECWSNSTRFWDFLQRYSIAVSSTLACVKEMQGNPALCFVMVCLVPSPLHSLIHAGRPPEPSHVACSSTIFWKHLVLSREVLWKRSILLWLYILFAIFHLSLSLPSPSPVVMGWAYNNCGFAGITSDHLSGSSSHFWGTHVPSTSSFE